MTTNESAQKFRINQKTPPGETQCAILARALIDPKTNLPVAFVSQLGKLVNAAGVEYSLAGAVSVDKTITPSGTTGNRTINKPAGSVNFAAMAGSLTVTNSVVTSSSIILCCVLTENDDMTHVVAQPSNGSFVIYPKPGPPIAEARVGFVVY